MHLHTSLFKLVLLSVCGLLVSGAPAHIKPASTADSEEDAKLKFENEDSVPPEMEPNDSLDTGLMYDKYLKEVLKILESDEELRKKMESASVEDIREGRISKEINFLPNELRDRLNDVKKEEINRLRRMIHAKVALEKGQKVQKSSYLNQIANHLDHKNPHSFEADDLTNLIKAATKDLESFDKERHDEYKQYEMEKELRREEKMKQLDAREREKAQEEYRKRQEELAKKSADSVHHPGSKEQLKQVWINDGFTADGFDPKTFFYMHDLNGDGFMDTMELEALFTKDLEKVYDGMDAEHNGMQMEEERRRMREHVMGEVDKDKDGLISILEFLQYSETSEFESPDESTYKTIDEQLLEHSLYTQDELDKYRYDIKRQEDEIRLKLEALKAEAKNLGGLRRELGEGKKEALADGVMDEGEKIKVDMAEEQVRAQEEKVQTLHRDLQEQSKEVVNLKQKVKTHEASEKIVENIKTKLDSLPPGEEKNRAVEQAQQELVNLKTAQELVNNQKSQEEQEQLRQQQLVKAEQEMLRQQEELRKQQHQEEMARQQEELRQQQQHVQENVQQPEPPQQL